MERIASKLSAEGSNVLHTAALGIDKKSKEAESRASDTATLVKLQLERETECSQFLTNCGSLEHARAVMRRLEPGGFPIVDITVQAGDGRHPKTYCLSVRPGDAERAMAILTGSTNH